jgi:hypothetical protein
MNQFGMLPMNLEFFTDLQDMPRLLMYLDEAPAALNGDDDIGDEDGDGEDGEEAPSVSPVQKTTSASGSSSSASSDLPSEEVDEVYGSSSTSSSSSSSSVASSVAPSTSSQNLTKSQQAQHQSFLERRRRMHAAMCELIEDFSLVSYETLDIQSAESVGRVLAKCDKANGYVFNANESSQHSASAKYASSLFNAISTDTEMFAERTLLVQEKYTKMKKPDEF